MRGGQRLAVATALAAAVCLAAACISRTPPPPGADGATIYELQGCAACHGDEGQGRFAAGPKLGSLGELGWTRATLLEFLLDPDAFCERDERLRAQRGRYFGSMPGYAESLTDEQRGVLVDWMLARWP